MSKVKRLALCLLSVVMVGDAVHAEQSQPPTEARLAKYVNVSFEIYGLEETAIILKEAATELVSAMERIKSGANNLTPGQLEKVASIARETNTAIRSLNQVLQNAGPAIQNAREPTRAMLSDVLSTAKKSAIDPTLESIDKTITKGLVIGVVASIAALFIGFWWISSITRQLKSMANTLLSIADDYEIVRKRPASHNA